MNALGAVRIFVFVIAFLLSAAVFVRCLFLFADDCFYQPDEDDKKKIKLTLMYGVGLAVLWAVFVFIPSKETLIEMKVAEMATYDNVQLASETIKEFITDIVNIIEKGGK